jgi:hypothetical protein
MKALVITTVASVLIIGSSLAQTPGSQAPAPQNPSNQNQAQPNQPTSGQAQNQSIRQQVQKNLQQAGYTDIKIMPESFLVRAEDKEGNPVMMVINPDSVTAITEINRGAETTGSGNAASQRGTAAGQPTNPNK